MAGLRNHDRDQQSTKPKETLLVDVLGKVVPAAADCWASVEHMMACMKMIGLREGS